MMASNPVAAKEGGMKDYGEACDYYMERWKGEMVIWWNKAVRLPTVLYRRLHSADQKDSQTRNIHPTDYIPCHPGLSGSPPKHAVVWWGDLSRDPVFWKGSRNAGIVNPTGNVLMNKTSRHTCSAGHQIELARPF